MKKIYLIFECGFYWFVFCNPIFIFCLLLTTIFYYDIILYIFLLLIEICLYLFFSYKILIGLKDRYNTFLKLDKLYSKNLDNIKKSILYELSETLCESRIVKLLCKKYNIKL